MNHILNRVKEKKKKIQQTIFVCKKAQNNLGLITSFTDLDYIREFCNHELCFFCKNQMTQSNDL